MFDSNNGCSVALSNGPLSTTMGEVLATDWKHFFYLKKRREGFKKSRNSCFNKGMYKSLRLYVLSTYRMSTEKRFDQLLVSQYEIKWSHS